MIKGMYDLSGKESVFLSNILRYCVFRGKPATDSDRSRPPIPIQAGHLFRLIPATP
ncbi:hypothetical protein GMSM_46300 [Geomonas sp. Red276]